MKKGILIKYGEIAIKGKNRGMFENQLLNNCQNAIRPFGEAWIRKEQGRFFVQEPADGADEAWLENAMEALRKVFGLVGISPVYVLDTDAYEAISAAAIEYVNTEYPENGGTYTFKVQGRRAYKDYPYTSMELAQMLGSDILDVRADFKVDVHKPEIVLWVELRNQVYIYSKTLPCVGGMPSGSAGQGCVLLSGGIDSPVAAYMMAKRGLKLSAVYFHAHPYTSEQAKDKVITLGKIVSQYAGPIRLYVVSFTEIQLDIYEKCPHDQLTIIMRRAMMRIAEKIAEKEGAECLITGESLGQVASQTLQSLNCTNAVCKVPVFRPVIGFDKQDIVAISKEIGAFETSILPYEDCCTIFVAKHPVTHPRLKSIEESESHLPDLDAQIERAVEDAEIVVCK